MGTQPELVFDVRSHNLSFKRFGQTRAKVVEAWIGHPARALQVDAHFLDDPARPS
jgi:hypothetical protein